MRCQDVLMRFHPTVQHPLFPLLHRHPTVTRLPSRLGHFGRHHQAMVAQAQRGKGHPLCVECQGQLMPILPFTWPQDDTRAFQKHFLVQRAKQDPWAAAGRLVHGPCIPTLARLHEVVLPSFPGRRPFARITLRDAHATFFAQPKQLVVPHVGWPLHGVGALQGVAHPFVTHLARPQPCTRRLQGFVVRVQHDQPEVAVPTVHPPEEDLGVAAAFLFHRIQIMDQIVHHGRWGAVLSPSTHQRVKTGCGQTSNWVGNRKVVGDPVVGLRCAIHPGGFFPIVVLRSHPKHRHHRHTPRKLKATRGANGGEHFVVQESRASADHQLMADGHHAATVSLEVLQPGR